MKVALVVALLGCTSPEPHPVQPATKLRLAEPLVLGETFTLDSHALAERRVINVYLPPGYWKSTEAYPVLYMPDGGLAEDFPHIAGSIDVSIKDEVIRPMIVVGVENTERRRDLVGATAVPDETKIAPHAGGTDKFRAFLRDELKPEIARRYHVTGESALVGESFAGLFVVETLLVEPDLFDAYLAIDPSVWWNRQALVQGAAARFDAWTARPKQLYVATGDVTEMHEGVAVLLDAIRDHHPAGLTVHYDPMPEEHHNTIFAIAAVKGFRIVFKK